jgi:hypothetical protein
VPNLELSQSAAESSRKYNSGIKGHCQSAGVYVISPGLC